VQLSLKDVSLDFGDGDLLHEVSLDILQGESVVLVGPSGAGKSVVLKLFAGLLTPTRGDVFLEDRNLRTTSRADLARLLLKVGMLFQKNALFDSLTVGENVAFPLREKTRLTEEEIQSKVRRYLDAVGILHAIDLFPDEISGGMQKRLGIARAVALDPEIVFYDDPTAGLDPITSRRIVDLILELRRERKATVVTVTNDMARAFQLADRLVMVVDGELIVTGDRESTLNHEDPRVLQFVHGNLEGPLTEQLA
jgi:phospholipid/cholesterol/gamma-HCH transport system ATP-binding protein